MCVWAAWMNMLLTDKQMSNQVVEHQPLDLKGFFYNENSNVMSCSGFSFCSTICFIGMGWGYSPCITARTVKQFLLNMEHVYHNLGQTWTNTVHSCSIFAAFLSSVPHHRGCFIPDLSLCHSCNSWKLIPPSDPSHPLAWFLGFDQSHKQTFQVNSVYSSDDWICPPTFSETKPQMVPIGI